MPLSEIRNGFGKAYTVIRNLRLFWEKKWTRRFHFSVLKFFSSHNTPALIPLNHLQPNQNTQPFLFSFQEIPKKSIALRWQLRPQREQATRHNPPQTTIEQTFTQHTRRSTAAIHTHHTVTRTAREKQQDTQQQTHTDVRGKAQRTREQTFVSKQIAQTIDRYITVCDNKQLITKRYKTNTNGEHLFQYYRTFVRPHCISLLFSFSFLVSDSESFLVLSFKFVFRIIFIFEMITPLSAQGQQSTLSGNRWCSCALIPEEEKNICSGGVRECVPSYYQQGRGLATGRAGRRGGTASEERTDRERHNNTTTTYTTHNDARCNAHTKHNTIVRYYTQEMHKGYYPTVSQGCCGRGLQCGLWQGSTVAQTGQKSRGVQTGAYFSTLKR